MNEAAFYKTMKTVDGEKCRRFREAPGRRKLLTDNMEWKNKLQEGFRLKLVPLTELFATNMISCFRSDQKYNFNEQHIIMLYDFHQRGSQSLSSLLQTDSNAESYELLEFEKYLKE